MLPDRGTPVEARTAPEVWFSGNGRLLCPR